MSKLQKNFRTQPIQQNLPDRAQKGQTGPSKSKKIRKSDNKSYERKLISLYEKDPKKLLSSTKSYPDKAPKSSK